MKKCPACRLELTTLLLSENILIDYCKRCKGSWFDAKELKSAHKEDPVLQSIVATTKLETTEITCSACGSANKRGAARCTVCEAGLRME